MIFKFLFLLFIIVIFFIIIGLSFIGNIIRAIFQTGHHHTNSYSDERDKEVNQSEQKKQVFEENEGEYVDFEEIKEDDKKEEKEEK
jgi:cytoskeletal protein RodZ